MLCGYLILKVIILRVWKTKTKTKKTVVSWRTGRPEEKERDRGKAAQ